jgi:AraC-like DNA-binding protein
VLASSVAEALLDRRRADSLLVRGRLPPSPDLAEFVDYYWMVAWDLRGREPYVAAVLGDPTIHLSFESDLGAQVTGIVRGLFTHENRDVGRVFGIKFHPGGFRPFVDFPLVRLTDRRGHPRELLGWSVDELERAMQVRRDDEHGKQLVEVFLRARLPAFDENIPLVRRIVARIAGDPELTRVDALVDELGLTKRALQRLLNDYVGVGAKWIIRRYRLREAAERLEGEVRSRAGSRLAELAASLGYFDQAHFGKDFKAMVGKTPQQYLHELREGP